jgi:hypothetical protein
MPLIDSPRNKPITAPSRMVRYVLPDDLLDQLKVQSKKHGLTVEEYGLALLTEYVPDMIAALLKDRLRKQTITVDLRMHCEEHWELRKAK